MPASAAWSAKPLSDERSLMRDALKHTMGEARLPEINAEFERRVESPESHRG